MLISYSFSKELVLMMI